MIVKACPGGISASARVVLEADPAGERAIARALQWPRVLWLAVACPADARVCLGQLQSWWIQALRGRAPHDLSWKRSRGLP
eukprot:9443172-Pyramimonas_sp.AAC.1